MKQRFLMKVIFAQSMLLSKALRMQ
jgi:predicted RNase H-like nuclease (RuvC/YqgF family)